jgi:hypothetical protein
MPASHVPVVQAYGDAGSSGYAGGSLPVCSATM